MGSVVKFPQHLMHQALVFQRRLAFQERRKIIENESGGGRIHGAGDLRKADEAIVGFDFEKADPGAQRLLEKRRSDGDILQLDDFDIGDLHCGPRLLIWMARMRVCAELSRPPVQLRILH
jgi:hypothetical protein